MNDWMRDRNTELSEALVGDGQRVSELILKLSEGSAQMLTLTGRREVDCKTNFTVRFAWSSCRGGCPPRSTKVVVAQVSCRHRFFGMWLHARTISMQGPQWLMRMIMGQASPPLCQRGQRGAKRCGGSAVWCCCPSTRAQSMMLFPEWLSLTGMPLQTLLFFTEATDL